MAMLAGKTSQRADINVTPLIDVLLVLLIIFMIILPDHENGLNTLVPQQPKADQEVTAKLQDIVITVCDDRTVRINQELVDVKNLHDRLDGLFSDGPVRPIFLRAEPDLEFGQVAEVIDIVKSVGRSRVAIMTR